MATDTSKLRRKRTSKGNVILNVMLVEMKNWLHNGEKDKEEEEIELHARVELLLEAVPVIKNLDDEIANLIDEDEAAEKDENEALTFHIKVSTAIKRVQKFFEKRQTEEPNTRGMSHSANLGWHIGGMGVKLPKIKIKIFVGDIAEWKSFIDTFEAAVDH